MARAPASTFPSDQGNVADAFEIIVNGVVESSVRLPGGSWKAVDRLSPGQYFGITSMMTSDPSDFRFTALTDVTVIGIDSTEFDYREANYVVYEQNGVTIHPVKASGRRQWTG